jgi:membrane-bound lytic murein transglycosylase B
MKLSFPALCLGLLLAAGCATQQPPPVRQAVVRPPAAAHKPAPAPDWFQRQLAAARQARKQHLPHSDAAGAQLAYYKVMLPACRRVEASGPEKYRPRCATLVRQAAIDTPAPPDLFSCTDTADDTPETATACND